MSLMLCQSPQGASHRWVDIGGAWQQQVTEDSLKAAVVVWDVLGAEGTQWGILDFSTQRVEADADQNRASLPASPLTPAVVLVPLLCSPVWTWSPWTTSLFRGGTISYNFILKFPNILPEKYPENQLLPVAKLQNSFLIAIHLYSWPRNQHFTSHS